MFASVDGLPFRWLRVYVSAPGRSEELPVPLSLEDQAHRVATWPHRAALRAFARAVIAREQRRQRPVENVRVEIWRADVSASLVVVERRLRHTSVDAHAGHGSGSR
jgi:hypothetical protein